MLYPEERFLSKNQPGGSIEIICGSMFSGKTEELIRRIRRAVFAKLPVEVFKPNMDIRYSEEDVVSHDKNTLLSTPVSHSSSILLLNPKTKIVGIDEAQFFDDELPYVCRELSNRGVRVIVAGLDMDFRGEPFGCMPQLMAIAEHVTKVHAVCVQCGATANFSYRIIDNQNRYLLGEQESYEPRCRSCFYEKTN